MDNPCSWLPDTSWDNITELEKLANFHGIITSFEQYPRDWNLWFTAGEPENTALPGKCTTFFFFRQKRFSCLLPTLKQTN